MSGVPVPTNIITEPFGSGAAALPPLNPGGVTLPIPRDSQVGVVVGAASFEDGFPAATMVDPEDEGGMPPFGQDMNGILYMITAYIALMQAGQRVTFRPDAAAEFAGYAVGAEVTSTTPGRVWMNAVDGNTTDPDIDPTDWASSDPLSADLAPPAGQLNNVVLPGASDFALDIDTTAGAVDISGFVARRNGQKLFVSNVGPNLLQFLAESGASAAANRIRSATDLALVQSQTLTLQFFSGPDRWLLV